MVCIILFIISAMMGKYDKLAYSLMALYVIIMALLVHLPRALGHEISAEMMTPDLAREMELEMVNVFRNIMVTGALLGFARFVARDRLDCTLDFETFWRQHQESIKYSRIRSGQERVSTKSFSYSLQSGTGEH